MTQEQIDILFKEANETVKQKPKEMTIPFGDSKIIQAGIASMLHNFIDRFVAPNDIVTQLVLCDLINYIKGLMTASLIWGFEAGRAAGQNEALKDLVKK